MTRDELRAVLLRAWTPARRAERRAWAKRVGLGRRPKSDLTRARMAESQRLAWTRRRDP
jgi:hypothetical protein